VLPEPSLDLPEVSRLPRKRRAVDAPEHREQVRVVAAEVGEERLLLVEAEGLADDLHRQHFGVVEYRLRPTPTRPPAGEFDGEGIIDKAEDCYNESVQVHEWPPNRERQALPLEGSGGLDFNFFKELKTCTRG
jgi:hypothetical protein